MARLFILLTSVVLPGAAHILMGRQLKGVLFALIFGAALAVGLSRIYVVRPEGALLGDAAFLAAFGTALGVWLYAGLEAYDRLYGLRRSAPRSEVDLHLRQGIVHFLRDELCEAERELLVATRLDPRDADVRMYLARVYEARGMRKKCRRQLRKCRALDTAEKWEAEIEHGLKGI